MCEATAFPSIRLTGYLDAFGARLYPSRIAGRKTYQGYGLILSRLVLPVEIGGPQLQQKIEAQLVIARHLLEDAKLLKIDVSGFEKRLSRIEKLGPEDAGGAVASLMSDLSKAIEESERAEKREAASIAANVESQLTELHSLMEKARTLGVDVSPYETGLSGLEKSLDKSRSEMTELRSLSDSIDTLMEELSVAVESSRRELEKTPTELEAEVYEYLMKNGGMSVSAYSKERGLTEEETKKAIDRLVELDMMEIRKV